MANRLATEVPAVAGEAGAVKTAVQNAVLSYEVQSSPGEDHSNAHGLSIYWPQWISGAYGDYVNHKIFTATRDGRWDDFLVDYFGRRPPDRKGMPVDPEPVEKRSAHTVLLPLIQKSD